MKADKRLKNRIQNIAKKNHQESTADLPQSF